MLSQIADLVEFSLARFTDSQVIEDFNHKFHNSILKIDGTYLKISQLEKQARGLILYAFDKEDNEIKIKELKTIEKVLPKTGLYSSDNGLVYLYRLPKRQWIKSLSLNNNYKLQVLRTGLKEESPTLWNTVLVDNPKYQKETCIYKDNVYLHWKKVGVLNLDTIIVTNNNFFEEIKELWNQQYQITLDVNHHPQKVEKLILDW